MVETDIRDSCLTPGALEALNDDVNKKSMTTAILKPKDIADSVLYVLATPPHVQIHELTIKPLGEVF
mgnify:CR=1 FL=1